jgi:hypothetical protein
MFPHVIGQATIATRPTRDACDFDTYNVARAVLGTSKTVSCRWVAQTSQAVLPTPVLGVQGLVLFSMI